MLSKITVDAGCADKRHIILDTVTISLRMILVVGGNSHYGYSTKFFKSYHCNIKIKTPRDAEATFEPPRVKKRQTRTTGMDQQVLMLYAKQIDITAHCKRCSELASRQAGSQVTNAMMQEVLEWLILQIKLFIIYMGCIVLKIRQDKRHINKVI